MMLVYVQFSALSIAAEAEEMNDILYKLFWKNIHEELSVLWCS